MNNVNIKMDKNLQWKLYQMGIKDIKKKERSQQIRSFQAR